VSKRRGAGSPRDFVPGLIGALSPQEGLYILCLRIMRRRAANVRISQYFSICRRVGARRPRAIDERAGSGYKANSRSFF